jgi:quercetin dioxygenase-like cupin family protein
MTVIALKDIPPREVIPGFEGRFIHSERATLVYWHGRKDALLPEHRHPHEQIANILKGRFELTIDGMLHELAAGDVAVIPPGALHSGKALTDCEILDVFSPVREDYRL